MLVSELIQSDVPILQFTDNMQHAEELFNSYGITELPVFDNEVYKGLLRKEAAETASAEELISTLEEELENLSVPVNQHIFSALSTLNRNQLTILPALNAEQQYEGCITHDSLLFSLQILTGSEENGGLFMIEMPPKNFSIGELCRVVETNDAYITQINTFPNNETGLLNIIFRINTKEISDVMAALQRYEYSIKYFFGEQDYENELRENYDHLITYLNI